MDNIDLSVLSDNELLELLDILQGMNDALEDEEDGEEDE